VLSLSDLAAVAACSKQNEAIEEKGCTAGAIRVEPLAAPLIAERRPSR